MASPSGMMTPSALPACLLAIILFAASTMVQPTEAATRKNSTSRVSTSSSSGGPLVVCYYTNWSVYRPGRAKFTPSNVNPYLCSHLIYAFGGLSSEDGLRPYDKYQDIEQGGYAKFNGLKSYNKALKTLLAVGGWNEGSARFSALAADPERRTKFAKGAVRFLRTHRFDGLDLDWEFPAFRDGGRPQDKENYAKLAEDLRAEFDKESSQTGRPRLLLTMAVPAGKEYIDRGFDMSRLSPQLDFLNILSYDYHSAFEPVVNHHSPLYPLNRVEGGSEYDYDGELCIDFTVKHYLKAGVHSSQLVLGIPTYGRSYTLLNPESIDPGSPADGPGAQGDATREKGYLSYYEICKAVKSDEWTVEQPEPDAMGPYAYKGDQWVGYDDPDTIRKKARYVHEMSLGGLMFWSVDNDDFRGDCHGKPYPLVEAGKEELLRLAGPSTKSTSKSPSRVGGSTSGNRRRPTGGNGGRKRRPSTTSTTTSTTTTTTPSYGSLTTPEPPTTPDPGSDFVCKDEGFFPHPRDCKKYFWCLDSGPSSLGIVAHQFTCPSGLFFNKAADSCDYSRNVLCKKKLTESTSTTTKAPATSAGTTTTRRTTARTTTTTTTTTEAPEYEEYDEEEEEEDGSLEEDPSALKELIGLIKKLGGLKELEKHLDSSNSGSKGTTASPINKGSSSLYERVLGSRGKRPPPVLNARRPPPPAPTSAPSVRPALKYVSLRRERPAKVEPEEQEEEFEEEEEEEEEEVPQRNVKTRRPPTGNTRVFSGERPKYVTINRPRPSTTPQSPLEEDEEEEEDTGIDTREPEPEVGTPRYVTIRRPRPTRVTEPEISTPRYQVIDRRRFGGETARESPSEKPEIEEKATTFPSTTSTPIHSSSFASIAASSSPSLLSSPESPSPIYSTTTAPSTVTRVITSVTEAATERQIIAVARVPYSVLLGARNANNRTTVSDGQDKPNDSASPGGSLAKDEFPLFESNERPPPTNQSVQDSMSPKEEPPSEVTGEQPPANLTTSIPEIVSPTIPTNSSPIPEENVRFSPTRKSYTSTTTEATTPKARTRTNPFIQRGFRRFSSPTEGVKTTTDHENKIGLTRTRSYPGVRGSQNQASQGGFRRDGGVTKTSTAPTTAEPLDLVAEEDTPTTHRPRLRVLVVTTDVSYSEEPPTSNPVNETEETTVAATTTSTTERAISTSRRPLFAPRGNTLALGRRRVTTARRKIVIPSARLGDDNSESHTTTVLAAAPLVGEERKIPAIRGTVRQKDNTPDVVVDGKGYDEVGDKRDGDLFEESEEVIIEVTSQKPASIRRPSTRRPSPRPTSSIGSSRTAGSSLPRRTSTTRRPAVQPAGDDDDYDYFDIPTGSTSEKVRVRVDGTVQCLDRGNFPHPLAFRGDDNIPPSCNRRFVSCAEVEGNILGWEYECPRHLTFDPIGGICNWAPEGLGCD